MAQQPVISPPNGNTELDLGGTRGTRRVTSAETDGAFSVLELVSDPGEGVGVHVHDNEDELVHVIDGEIEVTLGGQKMMATPGVIALLPRGIPHGFVNVGSEPSRIIDVILPGGFDEYFVAASDLVKQGKATVAALEELNNRFSVRFE